MRMWKRWGRSLGGAVGIAVAVAGGFGAAVGLYSLPNPQGAAVGAGATYASADQRAIAVWRQDYEWGYTRLAVEAARGGFVTGAGAGASTAGPPDGGADASVGARFHAELYTCMWDGNWCEITQSWGNTLGPSGGTAVPLSAFEFDPAMQRARFIGDVDGCHFDVEWRGDGLVAPYEGHAQDSGSFVQGDPFGAGANASEHGFAEVSRVAPAHLVMDPAPEQPTCSHLDELPNGYLSQGVGPQSVGVSGFVWSEDP